jgi:thioredoxin 1
MGENTRELNTQGFSDFISEGNVIVDFWAEWCGPCKIIGPVFAELAGEYTGNVSFGKVNIEENYEIADQFEVMSIPTLIFFKDGQPVDRVTGALPRNELNSRIKEVFGL